MDSYTERLLERTRQRREMLNQKLGKTPEPLPRKRLLEENTTQNVTSKTTDKESPGKRQCLREDELCQKPDTPAISSVKSRMQQILDNRGEGNLTEEHVEKPETSQKTAGSRRGRFAMLAQNINDWEDDLSHPTIQKVEEKKPKWQPPKKDEETVQNIPMSEPKAAASPLKKMTSQTSVSGFSPKKSVYSPVKLHNKGLAPTPPPPPPPVSATVKENRVSPVKHVSHQTFVLSKQTTKSEQIQTPAIEKLPSWKKSASPAKEKSVDPAEAPMSSKLAAWEKKVSNTPTKTSTSNSVNQPLRQVATTPLANRPPLPKPASTQAKPSASKEIQKDNADPASLPISSRMATWQQRVEENEPKKEEEPTAYSVNARMSAWEDMSSSNQVSHIKKVDPSNASPVKSPAPFQGKSVKPQKSFKDSIAEKSTQLKPTVRTTPSKSTPVKLQPTASPVGKVGSATKMMQQRLIDQAQHSKTDDIADKLRQDRMAELKNLQNRWHNGVLKDDKKPEPTTQDSDTTDRREQIRAKARADFEKKMEAMGFDVADENDSDKAASENDRKGMSPAKHVQGPPKPPHTSNPASIYRLISQKREEKPQMKRSESVKKVQFEEEDSFDSTEDEDIRLNPRSESSETEDTQDETTTTQDEESTEDETAVHNRKLQNHQYIEDDSDADDVSLSAFVPASVRRRSVLPSGPQQDGHSATPNQPSKRPVSHPVASVPTKVRTQSSTNLRNLAQESSSSLSSEDSCSSFDDDRHYHSQHYHSHTTDDDYEDDDCNDEDIDDLLDEAIEEGENAYNNDKPVAAPRKRKSMEMATDDNPLLYSVSMYRSKRYSKNQPSPAVKITRNREFSTEPEEEEIPMPTQLPPEVERKSIKERIQELQELVNQEQSVIMQTSNALNQCCLGNAAFAGSAEQVECNRLLLLACQKRQAYMTEIQRLKDTGNLDPPCSGPKGSLTISDIRLPLKKEFVTKIGSATDNMVHYFLILIRNYTQVIATQMLSTHDPMMKGSLDFPNLIKIHGISGNFKLNMEIYSMSISKEYNEKSKKRKTPKKAVKSNLHPDFVKLFTVQSPGGPSAVRTTNFTLITSFPITMRSLDKSCFTLERIPYLSPLHGTIYMRLKCLMEQNVEERGFLTMFEDVCGLGAWHRRWCVLAGNKVCFWKYPDDENRKEPIGFIDLKRCITEKVGLIPRDICARPNTFEFVTVRQPRRGEHDTLVTKTYNTMTTTKHNLSADTKEERIMWCNKINRALANIRTWHSDAMRPIKASR